MRTFNAFIWAVGLAALLCLSAAQAEENPTENSKVEGTEAPDEGNFFTKLFDAVKKGVSEGVDNGVHMAGNVKVLGYTIIYSKLQRSNQAAFCLASAETGKLITVSPVFGTPYQRSDGTTGFTVAAQNVDKHHSKIEVNALHVLPGLNCADLIAKHKLNSYAASAMGGGALGNAQNQGGGCLKPAIFIPYTTRYLCGANLNDGIGASILDISTQQSTYFKRGQCADHKGDLIPVSKKCITMFTSFRTDGQPPTPTYVGSRARGGAVK